MTNEVNQQMTIRLSVDEAIKLEHTLKKAKCEMSGEGVKRYILTGAGAWGTAETTGEKFAQVIAEYMQQHPEEVSALRSQIFGVAGNAIKNLFKKKV